MTDEKPPAQTPSPDRPDGSDGEPGLRAGSGPIGPDGPEDRAPARSVRSGLAEAAYFIPYLRRVQRLVIGVVALSLVSSLARLPFFYVPLVLTRHFGDRDWFLFRWLEPLFGSPAYLFAYLSFALVCMLAGGLLNLLRGYWSSRASEFLLRCIRLDVFRRIEKLSMKAVYSSGAGEFVQRLTRDLYYIRDLYAETFTQLVTSLLQVIVFIAAMLWLEPLLTLVLLGLFTLAAPLIRLINRQVERLAGRMQKMSESILSQLVECIGGYRDIRASGRFDRFADRFEATLRDAEKTSVRTTLWAQTGGVLINTTTSVLLVLPYLLYSGTLENVDDVGRLITYVGFLAQVLPILSMIARSTSDVAMATPSLRAVRGILEPEDGGRAAAVAEAGPAEPSLGAVGRVESIRFDHVSLELGGRWVLEDLNFEIRGGQLTAIVGQSGAGKTTIFHMLLRLIEPTQGTVWVNDRPLSSLDTQQLRRLIGFIPQNPFIFNQSIRENLKIALPGDDSDEPLVQAVEMAQLNSFIEGRRNEGGLDAVAGYMGMRLSAGERQRVALGRLIIQDPQVIVCDEYTANIDIKTANLIEEMMRTHFADRTRVVITHELHTIRGADHIVVIDQGRIESAGTHQSLVTRPGLYRTLWESQRLIAD